MKTLCVMLALASCESAPGGGRDDQALPAGEFSIATGREPKVVVIADVNHDSQLDLIVANIDSISVLLGDGKGHFRVASGSPVAAGPLPNDIAIADMNHDGNLDLVIANHQSPYLTILLGDGKGGFHAAAGSPIDAGSNPHPHGVAIGAFRGLDLDVVTDSWANNQIELLEGNGKGGLRTPGQFFRVGHRPYERLRSGDLNKDGLPDVVTTNMDDDTVSVLLGDRTNGFREAPGSPFPAGAKPWQVAIDDLDGDGNADLAIIPYERDVVDPRRVAVTLLRGNGKGQFTGRRGSPLLLGSCHGPNSIATGDLNGDGQRDIVVSCAKSKTLEIFFGHADNDFTPVTRGWAGGWGSVAIVDLDGDGKDDLVTANNDNGTVTIYLSKY